MSYVRIALRIVGVAALLGILVAALLGAGEPLEKGAPAPPMASSRLLDGGAAPLAFGGGKITVVNFWATWCPPCLAELPDLAAAARSQGSRVQFVGVLVDSRPEDGLRLVERLQIPYPVVLGDGRTSRAWNATALPSTYIVDADGKIAWSVRGGIDRDVLASHLAPLLK